MLKNEEKQKNKRFLIDVDVEMNSQNVPCSKIIRFGENCRKTKDQSKTK